ncbi:exopolysaccharide biosynthesis polyprenyl glycosylphosphotransferase [Streptomyces sp. NBC_00247]|uniref:exopolysaccharide biosynthesis polyprenyl glycosylphosphotransferase n=1 Tax=Streptomyces sp. NBC_00247 TaxID=2975689 RepID=UPI002E2CA79F|nr:exopolysaccharide biosynthesis polyprenyl glycosylphosphotransferase [Streptomyces sp. NBC_00247]
MGHVETPDSDISGPVGLRRLPRPRSTAPRNRTTALEQLWRAPTAQRDLPDQLPPGRRAARWGTPFAVLTETVGMAVPAWAVLSSRGQPVALPTAVVAALVWAGVRAVRGRWTAGPPRSTAGAVGGLGDWLVFVGLLAVAWAVAGAAVDPTVALVAAAPGGAVTAAVATAVRRRARATHRRPALRVLVVGEASGVDTVAGALGPRAQREGYAVVAAVPVGAAEPDHPVPVTGRLGADGTDDDVSTVLAGAYAYDVDLVLVAPGPLLCGDRLRRLGWGLQDGGVALCVLSALTGITTARVRPASVAGMTLLHVAPPLRRGPQVAVKSALDRSGALAGLALLAPLLLAVALGVRLSSRGPVFHRQIRHGRHDRPFTLWKFRTMVVDAESRKAELTTADEGAGPLFKMRHDPRVTGIGRALRRTSIDELPQLLNVLRGDMSLVGPRPPLPEEAAKYDDRERRRLAVKPGLTGLWQVSGRSDLSWEESVSLDLWYVDNWSVSTDMNLLARTVRAVTDGRGAY